MIRLGFALPQFGQLATQGDQVAGFAAEAERLGARSLWVGDRLLSPVNPVVGYGGGTTLPDEFRAVLDPFTLLTVAATATKTALLGSNVFNLPWYAPAVLARTLTTIDIVSNGRLLPGFGIGWSPDEYQAAGIPWAGRGVRLEESLDALEAIWGGNPAEYHGDVLTLPASHFDLRPVQRPRPPIYLGGPSEAALRRIGRRADGWLPAGVIPGRFTTEIFSQQREIVRAAAASAGRAVTDLPTVLRANVSKGTSVEEVVDTLETVAEGTGISDMFVDLMYLSTDVDDALDLARTLLHRTGSGAG
ncbi:MAG TPA: TIGR03619 family F420-dependent LLM class oxidoreductase [Pseudonocardiaceae bacterium]|jgi:probable F420-dependent oxidoreductase|nr:TIGR03619 family F420-dependent LLM class oxidoreductase [Pseudonocardiaceae bacterium]